jgi:hypothetical protein
MPTLQVTLSDRAAADADARAAYGGYASVGDYLASLIEADVAVPVSPALEAELLAGLAGDAVLLSKADFDQERRALLERHGRDGRTVTSVAVSATGYRRR